MIWAKTVTVGVTNQAVNIEGDSSMIEVINVDGGGDVYFTLDGTAAVVEADNNIVVPAGVGTSVIEPVKNYRPETPVVVNLIATASSKVQVRGRSI